MVDAVKSSPDAGALPELPREGLLLVCQKGFEHLAAREVAPQVVGETAVGGWWVAKGVARPGEPDAGWCFPHLIARGIEVHEVSSVNAAAKRLVERFGTWIRGARIESAWPCVFRAAEMEGLAGHLASIEAEFRRQLKERLGRVAKLASDLPRGVWHGQGLLVFSPRKGLLVLAREFRSGGQRRMADDPAAPSRSYLKTEEAFSILGLEPGAGQTVVDLGAAPGGWSYSAAKRGANVIAVDNGPMKGGAAGHPAIDHRREDAFRFQPGRRADWLLCDIVEDPYRVLRLLEEWTDARRCRRFVVNLKFGRADPLSLLAEVRHPFKGLMSKGVQRLVVRHLLHDREEFTLMGEVAD
jgi:23S rRNA (cytidine2498-2'-O)-methyltransferase